MKLILDLGSGNSCRNDTAIVKDTIDAITDVKTDKHEIILKWQLFESAPPNIPLDRDVFDYAYDYAYGLYKTTASVFDKSSLAFLQGYDTPFIKIACRQDLYYLADSEDDFYVSITEGTYILKKWNIKYMYCIPKYPADISDYEKMFDTKWLGEAISDHTVGWDLYNKYKLSLSHNYNTI